MTRTTTPGAGGRQPSRLGVPLAAAMLLAGCSADIGGLAQRDTGGARPAEILVAVSADPDRTGGQPPAQEVAAALQSKLIDRLLGARIAAAPWGPGQAPADADILHVVVTQADPGSRLERIVVGFGAGRAELRATADLEPAGSAAPDPLLAFSTASDSGYKPGLIIPGAVAAGTGSAIGLAIGGGIDIATNLEGGLAKPADKTATAIVAQLKKYYGAVGWSWPAGS